MHFLLFSFLLFLFADGSSAANFSRFSRSQPASRKALYDVFSVSGTDYDDTASFVGTTVSNDDLRPWTDVAGNLISWTVKADDSQVSQLSQHSGISRVAKLDLPSAPMVTSSPESTAPTVMRRQEAIREWIVGPTDPTDQAEVDQTFQYLNSLSRSEPKKHFQNFKKDFWFWSVKLTKTQSDEASKQPGVKGIGLNIPFTADSMISPAAAVPSKVKRDPISYDTQQNAATELAAISQPRCVPVERMQPSDWY